MNMKMLDGAILAVLVTVVCSNDLQIKERTGAITKVWQNVTLAEDDIQELYVSYIELMLSLGLIPKGYIGSPCDEDSDCVLDKTFCIDSTCVCDPGLLYSQKQQACLLLKSCTRLAETYTEFRGYYIGSHNKETIYSGSTVQSCKEKCNENAWCFSFDRRPSDGRCDLAEVTFKDVADSYRYSLDDKEVISHFARNCAD